MLVEFNIWDIFLKLTIVSQWRPGLYDLSRPEGNLVQTEGGNRAAHGMGLPQAPHTKRQSTDGILTLIDNATREKTSGKFFDGITGSEIPW
ncbi:hypothetical protein F4823DRAFT_568854 [Ustulina deusta]|nr:hypothetical protein F4823DRAFT_568854 [Ustulina deusta]